MRGEEAKRYMAADGPGSDQIRVLYRDATDSLWIGMLDGGLAELDINPLLVLPAGRGVKAVDALVVFKD